MLPRAIAALVLASSVAHAANTSLEVSGGLGGGRFFARGTTDDFVVLRFLDLRLHRYVARRLQLGGVLGLSYAGSFASNAGLGDLSLSARALITPPDRAYGVRAGLMLGVTAQYGRWAVPCGVLSVCGDPGRLALGPIAGAELQFLLGRFFVAIAVNARAMPVDSYPPPSGVYSGEALMRIGGTIPL